MAIETPDLNERLAEAARYALMRRLMPAIRHHVAGTLQPIGMLSAMLERRLLAAAPDMLQLGKNAQALNALAREAAATSLNLMTWLAPRDNDPVAVGSALEEALGLIATELSLRGFSVVNDAAGVSAQLPKGMLRSVFTASLIALTDAAGHAGNVRVAATEESGSVQLKISILAPTLGETAVTENRLPGYRALQWADVQALADAEGVQLQHGADSVRLAWEPGA